VPVRIAFGARDLENGTVEIARRDTLEKQTYPVEQTVDICTQLMDDIQANIYKKAVDFRASNIRKVDTWDEFVAALEQGGFVSAHWDGTTETEVAIKEKTKATIRCIPLNNPQEEGKCILTGKPSKQRVLFAIAY